MSFAGELRREQGRPARRLHLTEAGAQAGDLGRGQRRSRETDRRGEVRPRRGIGIDDGAVAAEQHRIRRRRKWRRVRLGQRGRHQRRHGDVDSDGPATVAERHPAGDSAGAGSHQGVCVGPERRSGRPSSRAAPSARPTRAKPALAGRQDVGPGPKLGMVRIQQAFVERAPDVDARHHQQAGPGRARDPDRCDLGVVMAERLHGAEQAGAGADQAEIVGAHRPGEHDAGRIADGSRELVAAVRGQRRGRRDRFRRRRECRRHLFREMPELGADAGETRLEETRPALRRGQLPILFVLQDRALRLVRGAAADRVEIDGREDGETGEREKRHRNHAYQQPVAEAAARIQHHSVTTVCSNAPTEYKRAPELLRSQLTGIPNGGPYTRRPCGTWLSAHSTRP